MSFLLEFIFMLRCTPSAYHDGCVHCMRCFTACVVCVQCRRDSRLLVQNAGWGYSATISWYLIGAFARGMHYESDGLLRAEWPTSGHWEVTPMLWMTMHWTLFTEPGWNILQCATPQCTLAAGGNYAAVASPSYSDITIIVETFQHETSQCVRHDPTNFPPIAPSQTVTIVLPTALPSISGPKRFEVFRSCAGWRYPADDDDYMVKLADIVAVPVAGGGSYNLTFTAVRDCYYTVTTVAGRVKPPLPLPPPPPPPPPSLVGPGSVKTAGMGGLDARPAAFPLPYTEDFEGRTAGSEAPFFGDQQGKWETVPAGGGRAGMASQQQLRLAPWPIIEPQCNQHSQPISIIGDYFFESTRVSADLLIEEADVGAGVALRVRELMPQHWRGKAAGLYLYLGAIPAQSPCNPHCNPGGVVPAVPNPKLPFSGWALCADSYCNVVVRNGALPAGSPPLLLHWHTVSLEVTDGVATGTVNNVTIFEGVAVSHGEPALQSRSQIAQCVANSTVVPGGHVIVGGDYKQVPLAGRIPLQIAACEKACCSEVECTAWAVKRSECWLKKNGRLQGGSGEDACGFKPTGPPPPPTAAGVPVSGWAAIVSTLGRTQVDNFKLVGTAGPEHGGRGEHAAPACNPAGGAPPHVGSVVASTPCDLPGAYTGWTLSSSGTDGAIELRNPSSQPPGRLTADAAGADVGDDPSTENVAGRTRSVVDDGALCIGVTGASAPNVTVVQCGTDGALRYNRSSGQIVTAGAAPVQQCLTATQKPETYGAGPPTIIVADCGKLPSEAQQFQFNPDTGALRQKGSHCIAEFATGIMMYRDCCIALCAYA